jgi:hypothetical protein
MYDTVNPLQGRAPISFSADFTHDMNRKVRGGQGFGRDRGTYRTRHTMLCEFTQILDGYAPQKAICSGNKHAQILIP